jgi:hypothetical protein
MTAFNNLLDDFTRKLESPRIVKTPQAIELEALGPFVWLKTLFPRSFRQPFSDCGKQYWRVMWRILYKRWNRMPLTVKEYSIMAFFARGLGKSTHGEATSIAEGGIVGEGYDLYLSDTDDMAEEHLYNIAELINQGQVEQFYPLLAKPKINLLTGEQAEFSKRTLITEANWSVTAKGLRGNVRGSRKANLRFTMVFGDDIDRLDESLVVVEKKKRNLTRSVLGAGTTQMQFVFLQNIIEETSIANQIWERKTDMFSERTVIGGKPVKAFEEIKVRSFTDKEGALRHEITHCTPHWPYFDLEAAKKFLAQAGKEAFFAEYQHEFDLKKDKVVPNFNRKAQVISWSMFAKEFGTRYIPSHWTRRCAADIGYTEKSNAAWSFVATSAFNEKLPNKRFMYKGMTFVNESIDKQMLRIWKSAFPDRETGREYFEFEVNFGLYPSLFRLLFLDPKCRPYLEDYTYDPEYMQWRHPRYGLEHFFDSKVETFHLSHEKSGEVLTINEMYGLPVTKIEHFGSEDGVSQWNQLCAVDPTTKNPFHEDEKITDDETGEQIWAIGCPELFYIVDDEQYIEGLKNDLGLKKHIENVAKWKYVRQNITEQGVTEAKPMKMEGGDTCDSERAVYVTFGAQALGLTSREAFARHIHANHKHLSPESIQALPPDARGFAEIEREEVKESWEKGNSDIVMPKGLVDF